MMAKMSISEASEFFNISKEAIHNRIRRGSLSYVIEDNVKYVVVDETQQVAPKTQTKKRAQKSTDERYYALLEEQNAKLQAKVEKLEDETRSLRDQKEQMLIAERQKIEAIYKEKDEQLKNILTSFKAQFLVAPTASLESSDEEFIEHEEDDIVVESEDNAFLPERTIVSLKKYLKDLDISQKKREKIKARFKKRAKKDDRVIRIGKKYYLDLDKYDYEDLLK